MDKLKHTNVMICLGEIKKIYEVITILNNINLKQTDPLESVGTLCIYRKIIFTWINFVSIIMKIVFYFTTTSKWQLSWEYLTLYRYFFNPEIHISWAHINTIPRAIFINQFHYKIEKSFGLCFHIRKYSGKIICTLSKN